MSPQSHFHIRWSTTPLLDWQAFQTRAEAEETARDLVRPDETYAIEEFDHGCERCASSQMRAPRAAGLELDFADEPEVDCFHVYHSRH